MSLSEAVLRGGIVRTFLQRPLDRRAFDAFFQLCLDHARGYLLYLKARDYRLPLETRAGGGGDPLGDLALDLLGPLLVSSCDQPFAAVFDYFRRSGITDFEAADADELYSRFTVLIRGFVRKELCRIGRQLDPQVYHLKRRFKDLLSGPEYHIFHHNKERSESVCLNGAKEHLRAERPAPTADGLAQIVEQAYRASRNRSQWCRAIFELLGTRTEFRNFLLRHVLLRTVIAVNARYQEMEGLFPTRAEGPDTVFIERRFSEAVARTCEWVEGQVTPTFVRKGRISDDESRCFVDAVELYLSDLSFTGTADLLPAYFREVMPAEDHARYLRDYKYVFESTLNRAVEHFRGCLEKKSTIPRIRGSL